jgi:hypothetical protein
MASCSNPTVENKCLLCLLCSDELVNRSEEYYRLCACVCLCVCVCDLAISTVRRSRPKLACSANKNRRTSGTRCMHKNEFLCRFLFSLRKLALITSPAGHLEVIPRGCSEVPHKEVFTLFLRLLFCLFILSSFFPSY